MRFEVLTAEGSILLACDAVSLGGSRSLALLLGLLDP
jgi:hypothetical protein